MKKVEDLKVKIFADGADKMATLVRERQRVSLGRLPSGSKETQTLGPVGVFDTEPFRPLYVPPTT